MYYSSCTNMYTYSVPISSLFPCFSSNVDATDDKGSSSALCRLKCFVPLQAFVTVGRTRHGVNSQTAISRSKRTLDTWKVFSLKNLVTSIYRETSFPLIYLPQTLTLQKLKD